MRLDEKRINETNKALPNILSMRLIKKNWNQNHRVKHMKLCTPNKTRIKFQTDFRSQIYIQMVSSCFESYIEFSS